MTIAIDSSTPGIFPTSNAPTSGATLTSGSFSPPAGSLLVLFYGNSSNLDAVLSITDNLGTHLTYQKLAAEAANASAAEIWVADAVASGAMTVTVDHNSSTLDVSLGIIVLTGAAVAASQTGKTGTATGTAAKPSVALAATAAGSWCFGSIANFSGTTPTVASGQADSFNSHTFLFNDTVNGGTQWAQGTTAPTSGGTVTINDTAPTCQFSMVAVEILAATSAPTSIPDLIMAPPRR